MRLISEFMLVPPACQGEAPDIVSVLVDQNMKAGLLMPTLRTDDNVGCHVVEGEELLGFNQGL
jgi:hypothetical protein